MIVMYLSTMVLYPHRFCKTKFTYGDSSSNFARGCLDYVSLALLCVLCLAQFWRWPYSFRTVWQIYRRNQNARKPDSGLFQAPCIYNSYQVLAWLLLWNLVVDVFYAPFFLFTLLSPFNAIYYHGMIAEKDIESHEFKRKRKCVIRMFLYTLLVLISLLPEALLVVSYVRLGTRRRIEDALTAQEKIALEEARMPSYKSFLLRKIHHKSSLRAFAYLLQDLLLLPPRAVIFFTVFKEKSYRAKLQSAFEQGSNPAEPELSKIARYESLRRKFISLYFYKVVTFIIIFSFVAVMSLVLLWRIPTLVLFLRNQAIRKRLLDNRKLSKLRSYQTVFFLVLQHWFLDLLSIPHYLLALVVSPWRFVLYHAKVVLRYDAQQDINL